MKKILVPTDFSKCAKSAASIALKIGKKTGASIDFMHLVPTIVDWVKLSVEEEKKYPELKKKIGHAHLELNNLVEEARKMGIESEKIVAFTQNEDAILEHALNHECDLIVMGSQGASGLKELVIGSNTQYLVRKSLTPILVVKEDIQDFEPKKIMFASTFEKEVYIPFTKILTFASEMKAEMDLVYINDEEHFEETRISETRMKLFKKAFKLENSKIKIYNAKNIEQGIIHYAEDNQSDLIAVITYGRKGFKRLFMSSLTEKLVNHSQVPILSVNVRL